MDDLTRCGKQRTAGTSACSNATLAGLFPKTHDAHDDDKVEDYQ